MPEFQSIIESCPLWQERNKALSIESLRGGTTNFNYLVSDGLRQYVARFAQKTNKLLGLDRSREVYNTEIAYNLSIAPQVVAHYPDLDLLILEYIPGEIFTPEIARQSASIRQMARNFLKLHRAKKFDGIMDPIETIHHYVETAFLNKGWIPQDIDSALDAADNIAKELRISCENSCHLDLMMENIVKTGMGLKLLDWEYSACSDYRFDLAMLSVRGNFSKENDQLLVSEYNLGYGKELFHHLQLMKAIVFLREATWALVQINSSKINFDYRQYAIDNFEGHKEILQKI